MAFSHLPTLDAQPARACPKPEKRATTKRRKQRTAAKVVTSVRAQCVERDRECRYQNGWAYADNDPMPKTPLPDHCHGPSEWAHMHERRRSKTRGQAPEIRHTTAASLMLCQRHHDQYDGRQSPRLFITALTRRGADGPLRFRRAK